MAFVPASRMAEHPKQWWTSKIRGKCAGKRPRKAGELALAKPNIRTFSMANVLNAKVESWCMLARFNVEKLNNENHYCIPLCMVYIYINICIAILLLGLKVSIKNWNSFHESPEATSAANLDMVQNFTQLCLSMARHREICSKKGRQEFSIKHTWLAISLYI